MKAKKLATKIIAIVLAVVVGLGAIYGVLSFFDVPEKAIKVTFQSTDGKMTYKMSGGEFNYYYLTTFFNIYQEAAYYEQMGQGMGLAYTGFDYSKAPSDQPLTAELLTTIGVTLEELGNPKNPTWSDAITYFAINNFVSTRYGAEMAKKNNISLSEEEKTQIESNITEIKMSANQNDYSINRWLRAQYGKGVTEKVVRTALESEYLSQAYFNSIRENISSGITDDDIIAEYDANRKDYDVVDIRMYKFTTSIDEKEHADLSEEEHEAKHEELFAETKEKADAFLEKVTDEKSFINAAKAEIKNEDVKSTKDPDATTLSEQKTYADLSTDTEELAKWVFDEARQVGDKTVIDNGAGSYYVVFMKTLPYQNDNFSSVDVRHILIKFPDPEKDADGKAIPHTDKQKEETKAEAQKVLDEYLEDPTENNFIALTNKYSEDVDSLNRPNNDGLYQNVSDNGQYVAAFTKWSVDGERKAGDTGLVETEYGYHIMYFVKANEETPKWEADAKEKLVQTEYTEVTNEIVKVQTSAIEYETTLVNWMEKRSEKSVKKLLTANRR